MLEGIYKWLPIIFGCHCKKNRSFHYHGKQLPICARCTGELIGMIASIILYYFFHPNIYILLMLMIPLIFDGFLQQLTSYESKNTRRCITGILFGYALATLLIMSFVYIYQIGYAYGLDLFKEK